jgi:ribonuclease HI
MTVAACLRPAFLGNTRSVYTDGSVKGAHAGIGINYSTMRCHECYSLPRLETMRQDNNHAELAAIFVAILRTSDDFHAKLYTDSETCIRLLHQGSQHKRFRALVACTRWLQENRRIPVSIRKVKAHSGNRGNDMADALAEAGRTRPPIILPDVLWPNKDLSNSIIPGLINECVYLNTWNLQSY